MVYKVIDVSRYQGDIDFNKVKADGVDGVIIRAGIGKYSDGSLQEDSKFQRNITGFESVNIPIGLYYFSQATNESEAAAEANYLISLAQGHNITFPLVYGIVEDAGRILTLTKEQITKNALAFCKVIKDNGYKPCVYTFLNFFNNRTIQSDISNAGYDMWLAHYTSSAHPEYENQYAMWQYTSSGSINGISGTVDVNHCYKDYVNGGDNLKFKQRLTAPASTDKNWIKTTYGGNNHAIVINSTTGEVTPNCTGYVHGRWLELGLDESKLCLYNADQYYNYTKDGFTRGKTPKLGAIMCWSCPGKAGHVASVEGFTSSTSVTASQSNYGGTKFYTKTFNPNTWPSGYTFQGYIYPPVEFSLDGGIGTPVTRDETKIQVQVAYDYLRARSTPSTSGKELGYINRGIYNMPSSAGIVEANNYKWYEVESNIWIADVGEPEVTILPATQTPKDYSALLKIGFASTGDIKTIKAFIKEKGIDCTTPETGYLITVTAPSGKDRDDIDAKCLALGVPCVEYASNDDAKIEELQQQIKVLTAQVTTLTTQLSETNNELTSMTTELESIKASNNTLTASNELYVSVLKEIDEAIDKLN